jgi:hypothetical protein
VLQELGRLLVLSAHLDYLAAAAAAIKPTAAAAAIKPTAAAAAIKPTAIPAAFQ